MLLMPNSLTFCSPRSWLAVFTIVLVAGCSQPSVPTNTPPDDPSAFVFAPEPPPSFIYDDGLRVATLNTEFMFDGYGDEGQASFPHQGDPEAARAHRDRIADILRMLDADVVMLQEVENEQVLEMLLRESLASSGYRIYFVEGNDTFTGQDVALLSRVPVEKIGRTDERAPVGASTDTYGVSKNMYARLAIGDTPTTIIGLHFLARPDDPTRKDRREAQAEVIRRLVVEEMNAGRAVIVLGDFNDFDEETLDLGGNQPITDVLARIKRADNGAEDDLHNVMADVPQVERFTSFYDRDDDDAVDDGELSAIDHILLSPQLYQRVREVVYVQAHDPVTHTDHFPVVINVSVP